MGPLASDAAAARAGGAGEKPTHVRVATEKPARTSKKSARMSKLRRESLGSSPEEAAAIMKAVEDLSIIPRDRLGRAIADIAGVLRVDLAAVVKDIESISTVGLAAAGAADARRPRISWFPALWPCWSSALRVVAVCVHAAAECA